MTARTQEFVSRLVVLALGVGCFLGLVHALSVIWLRVPFDPNEGWNAYFAQMAMTYGTPYPAEGEFLVNNYPPLSFFVVGELGRLIGDNILAGRAVSLLAMLIVALGIAEAVRRMGCNKVQAAFAALFFISGIFLTSDYAGMDDPQFLGHAIAIWGLVVVLRTRRTPRAMVVAALVLTLAFFVKHNLVLLPLALGTWLLLFDKRHAVTFIATGVIFLLVGTGMFREIFGTSLFHQLASARIYAPQNIWTGAQTWLVWAAVPIIGATVLLFLGRRDQQAMLAVIYAGIATVGGLWFLGGDGVDANALFDADIALAICAGVQCERLGPGWRSAGAALAYAVPLVLLLDTIDGDWSGADYWRHPMAKDKRVADDEIALLHASREPVLCEMLSLCYWAGKSAQVDVFNTDQRIRTGAQDAAGLVRLVEARRYSIIQLETLHPFPLPPAVENAVLQNYRIVRSDGERVFLAPR